MRNLKKGMVALAFMLCVTSARAAENAVCHAPTLQHEEKNEATIQRLENAWSVAYLRGDTNFERCLLTSDFTEILRSGEVRGLSGELALAAKNKGKDMRIPNFPRATVFIHGNVAVAYGVVRSADANGQARDTRYADYYVWENGSWRAFFAQQTGFSQ